MQTKLTVTERQKLISLHRQERNGKKRDRIKAVLLFDKGYSYVEIAQILLLDEETIRRHISDYYLARKLSNKSGGSSSHLTRQQTTQLVKHLEEKTYLYVKDISAYVKQRYGINYSVSGMTKWLKNNGYRYKKPQAVPGKVNQDSQEAFKKYYKSLKASIQGDELIYFVDSVHPQYQTKLSYGWIKRGVRKNIATTGKQKRLNYMGGLSLSGYKMVVQRSEKVDAQSIKRFMGKLRVKSKGYSRIHIIWDNAGYHRSKDVQGYAEELNIVIHYLPPYSPNLNPIERLWKIMHEQVSYNRYYAKFSDFIEATQSFFRGIARKKNLLRSRISDNFQILSVPDPHFEVR